MKSRIRGGDAARAAVDMAARLPVPLLSADGVETRQLPASGRKKRPPSVRKPSALHDIVHAPTNDLERHKADLRASFGETLSDQFVETMMGKLIAGLRPNHFDNLDEATLNAALVVIASFKPKSEIEALIATQVAVAGFAAFRMLSLSQRHLSDENIAVYGGYGIRLLKIQNELIATLDRHRRGNSQTVNVKHVHIHSGGRGMVGVVNAQSEP